MIHSLKYQVLFSSALITFLLTYYIMPKVVKKMKQANICGNDVNKIDKPTVPEMGGIGGVLGFSLGLSLTIAIFKYLDFLPAEPLLVSISVLCIASLIGLLDDVSILGRKEKAWFISFASLPLIISQISKPEIDLIFYLIEFNGSISSIFFWIFIVPFGVTCCANALNMSAGYNGLESGQIVIISASMLTVSLIKNLDETVLMLWGGILGSSFSLYLFNKYPAQIFVGDVGTLGFGALIASTVILSNQILFGVICIFPSFYELYSTLRYKVKGIERRGACMNPQITEEGILIPPEGSEDYTLSYLVLSYSPCNEKTLVNRILAFYFFSGLLACLIAFIYG